ncbi:MAG TPA: MCE family protein [Acidimicrobiales bacterium]|nr:MCE family protein [Acidimicrobiales bacterium]
MITRRIVVNLVAFGVLSLALVAYGFFDLLGNPLAGTTTVSTVLPTASGLSPNFLVTLDGVDVGLVKSVSLVPRGARVTMALNPGTRVPEGVRARVVIANALGEQEVELVPSPKDRTGQYLSNGAVIVASPDSTPANVGTVVAEATRLLQAIPAGALDSLLHETAVALNANAGNLRTIASASELFSQEFLAQQQQFEALLANAPPVLDTVTQNASALQHSLADTAVLAEVLATHSSDLVRLFGQGTSAASALESLVTHSEPNLACVIHDASDIASNLSSGANLSNLDTALRTNQVFFGAVANVAQDGPAEALTSKDSARSNQEWLRTRLLLPPFQVPSQPNAVTYTTPTKLPPVLPGAGCSTEFGQGVGPATQAGFKPVGPGANVVAPTTAEAQVRGGGPAPDPSAPAAARVGPGASQVLAPTLTGLVVLGLLVTMGHRRRTRSARPLRPAARAAKGRG